jgi:glycosyltransferase involved in cell wall biosynthesis
LAVFLHRATFPEQVKAQNWYLFCSFCGSKADQIDLRGGGEVAVQELGEPSVDAAAQTVGMTPRVSVVLPTLNEAENLPHILPLLGGYEVIVVDGGSTDGTLDVVHEYAPDAMIIQQTRRGKGNALMCGIEAAAGDIVVTLDADGSARVDEIPRFVAALDAGADFAKGSRHLEGGGSADLTLLRSLGNRFLGLIVNVLFGTRYTDLCYGFNAFWTKHAHALEITCDGFEVETLLHLRAHLAQLVVVEVPSYEELRLNGSSKLRPFRDGFRILRTIMQEWAGRRESRFPEPTGEPLPEAP